MRTIRRPDTIRAGSLHRRLSGSEAASDGHHRISGATNGLPQQAPFDAIISPPRSPVPPSLAYQLVPGGRLVQPIGPGDVEVVRLSEKESLRLMLKRSIAGTHSHRCTDGTR